MRLPMSPTLPEWALRANRSVPRASTAGFSARAFCALLLLVLCVHFLLHALSLTTPLAAALPLHLLSAESRPVTLAPEPEAAAAAPQRPAGVAAATASAGGGGVSGGGESISACIRRHLRPRPQDFGWAPDSAHMPAPPIAIVGIFKNEATIMREWLTHYVEQGIEVIFLVDNGSTDDWQSELKGFEDIVTVVSSDLQHAQVHLYNNVAAPWLRERGIELALTVDLDEFAFSLSAERPTLAELAWGIYNHSDASLIATVNIPWVVFGSSGFEEQPASVRESFTMRKWDDLYGLGKSFARLSMVSSLGIHVHESPKGVRVAWPLTQVLGFRLNHYPIQSKKWYEKTKMTRGDVGSPLLDTVRNWDYFNRYDFKEYNDTLLVEQVRSLRLAHPECYLPR